jgi:hypothetical protein
MDSAALLMCSMPPFVLGIDASKPLTTCGRAEQ